MKSQMQTDNDRLRYASAGIITKFGDRFVPCLFSPHVFPVCLLLDFGKGNQLDILSISY